MTGRVRQLLRLAHSAGPTGLTGASRLSLRLRLHLLAALLVAGLASACAVALLALAQSRAAAAGLVNQAAALSQVQTADMAHDGLRSAVYAALLSRQPGAHVDGAEARQSLSTQLALMQEARDHLAELLDPPASATAVEATVRLPAELRSSLQAGQTALQTYQQQALTTFEAVMQAPGPAADLPPQLAQELARFEQCYAEVFQQFQLTTHLLTRHNADLAAGADELQARAGWRLAGLTLLALLLFGGLALQLIRSIRLSLARVGQVADAVAAGDITRRCSPVPDAGVPARPDQAPAEQDELARLGRAVDAMADKLGAMLGEALAEGERHGFGRRLAEAFEMADAEPQAYAVVRRALVEVAPDRPMELLLADSSQAALQRATEHPLAGAPGCGVDTPFACQAVRRGTVVVHADSRAIQACPRLHERRGATAAFNTSFNGVSSTSANATPAPCSAACVPLHFMGRALGVLHVRGPVGEPLAPEALERLVEVGSQAAARIGVVRAFQRTQLQAATDATTGLVNRRALESRLHDLLQKRRPFALVMADLDHFKHLNDTHGHLVGDDALRLFAETLQQSVRETDTVARWGGEEFCIVLAGSTGADAQTWATRARSRLAQALAAGRVPRFTASFGISDSAMAGHHEALLRIADDALYRAKAAGRDRAELGQPDDAAEITAHPRQASEHQARIDPERLAAAAAA